MAVMATRAQLKILVVALFVVAGLFYLQQFLELRGDLWDAETSWQMGRQKSIPLIEKFRADKKFNAWDSTPMLWDLYEPWYNCKNKMRVGNLGDGGKWVCNPTALPRNCIAYSFGSAGMDEFEKDLKALTSCEIHIFDPSLREDVLKAMESNERYIFHDLGLGPSKTNSPFKLDTLENIMRSLNHNWIDVLKIDIEGWEWAVFSQLLGDNSVLPVGQLLIELHHNAEEHTFRFFEDIIDGGYRIFSKEPNMYAWRIPESKCRNQMFEYSFIRNPLKKLSR